jgi:glycine/D-amino acid oxidase-like deaminating enzyme
MYDVIIIGAGIAGLYCALQILDEYPQTKLAILEKYNYIGGRIVTFRKTLESGKKVQWEIGAGRISGTHERTKRLLKEYGLHLIPISPRQEFRQEKNLFHPEPSDFSKHANIFLEATKSLTPEILRKHTIFSIATKILGKENAEDIFDRFPYWAEPNLMRADLAIQTLQGVVGQEDSFFVCQEGLGALTDAMAENIKKLGGKIFLNMEVNGIQHIYDDENSSGSYDIVSCIRTTKSPNSPVTLKISARKTIFALHLEALQKIPQLAEAPFLGQLKMSPLIRIYAVFPTEKGKSWFSGIPKTVCPSKDNPIRFFIPINPTAGVTMISYAEGPSADHWIKMVNTPKLEKAVMNAVRKLFPEIKEIPDPLFFKAHPWYSGCSYWIPGDYDVKQAIQDSLNPLPDKLPTTYVCGESTSPCQTWIEGALESAEMLINHLRSNT